MYVPLQSAYFLKALHFPSVKAMVLNFMWLKWLVMLNWIAGLVNTPKLDDSGPGFPPRDDGGGGGGGGGGGSSSGGFFLFAFLLFLSYLKDLEAEKESWEFGEDMTTVVRGLRFAKILKLQRVIECIILFPLENYHVACCRKCNLVCIATFLVCFTDLSHSIRVLVILFMSYIYMQLNGAIFSRSNWGFMQHRIFVKWTLLEQ